MGESLPHPEDASLWPTTVRLLGRVEPEYPEAARHNNSRLCHLGSSGRRGRWRNLVIMGTRFWWQPHQMRFASGGSLRLCKTATRRGFKLESKSITWCLDRFVRCSESPNRALARRIEKKKSKKELASNDPWKKLTASRSRLRSIPISLEQPTRLWI